MIWILLIVYQIKHFLADYLFQTPYMLGKFKKFPDFIHPLAQHASVHAGFTIIISVCSGARGDVTLGIGLLDFVAHFIVDRVKASPDMLGRFKALSTNEMRDIIQNKTYVERFPGTQTSLQIKQIDGERLESNKYFWWALGADQMAHHLTHYAIIAILVLT